MILIVKILINKNVNNFLSRDFLISAFFIIFTYKLKITIMVTDFYLQIIGYIASAFVLTSFISKDIFWIRTLSLIGSLIFTFYCTLNHDVILTFINISIAGINLFHLYKLIK